MISQNKKTHNITHTHTKPSIAWEMDSSCVHEMNSQTLESMLACTKPRPADPQQEKKARPADAQSQKCPRCDSPNTKFCYYNNYSLSQPRYFCKSCRRYWTKGGTLRNVPIGGGCRRPTKRSSSTSSRRSQDHLTPPPANLVLTNPFSSSSYDSNDLSLAFARLQKQGGSDDFSIFGSYSSNGPNQYLAGDHFLAQPLAQNMNYLEMGGVSGPAQEEMEGPHEGRVLWGFPWMQSSGGDGNWQGLLNSPLV